MISDDPAVYIISSSELEIIFIQDQIPEASATEFIPCLAMALITVIEPFLNKKSKSSCEQECT